MAIKRKKSPLFAMLFADLMMGAMGVIIVLLVFLQVVPAKGFGTEVNSSAVRLPPGLLDNKAEPTVRLRIAECDNEHDFNIVVTGYKKDDDKPSYYGTVDNCDIYIRHYPKGLHGSKLEIISKQGQQESSKTHITVSVGGYIEHHTIDHEKQPGQTLAIIAIRGELIDEQ